METYVRKTGLPSTLSSKANHKNGPTALTVSSTLFGNLMLAKMATNSSFSKGMTSEAKV